MSGVTLVGSGQKVPCGETQRDYISLDSAASTPPLQSVSDRVNEFLPWYSSVHRGAGYKSQFATDAYENARRAVLQFANRDPESDVAIFTRNTTDSLNCLAHRLQLTAADVVLTTVIEHHANMLPWRKFAKCRYVECDTDGTFCLDDVTKLMDSKPVPALLAITAGSNVTGFMPDTEAIIEAAHQRGIRVVLDAAQISARAPICSKADFVAFSGHKMYAPYGVGVLIGPRSFFQEGTPFLWGGGAIDVVDLDEIIWTSAPDRDEAGTPNVVGAVALHAAIDALTEVGWDNIRAHELGISNQLRKGLTAIDGVTLLGPDTHTETLAVASFTVSRSHYALIAARLSAEFGLGVRHGCFCAHPYLTRLLDLSVEETDAFRTAVISGDRRRIPGAVRASAGLCTSKKEIDYFLECVSDVASERPVPFPYEQNPTTGDFGVSNTSTAVPSGVGRA